MKFITFSKDNQTHVGVLNSTQTAVHPIEQAKLSYSAMNELIEHMTDAEYLALVNLSKLDGGIPLSDVHLLAPIPRPKQDIICLGINYAAHAIESARYKKEAFERDRAYPIYFSKRVNCAVADGNPINGHFDMLERLDYEAELAVIIGRDCSHVAPKQVRDFIFGYTIINDISAREIQTRHKQWYFGKSLDDFTPMGPCIVTADEIAYPPALSVQSFVNGELRQNSNTNLLIFDIDYIVSELSQGMTLEAGTIISTGTPAGVGMGFEPPRFLKPQDVIECRIEGIGSLTNTIK